MCVILILPRLHEVSNIIFISLSQMRKLRFKGVSSLFEVEPGLKPGQFEPKLFALKHRPPVLSFSRTPLRDQKACYCLWETFNCQSNKCGHIYTKNFPAVFSSVRTSEGRIPPEICRPRNVSFWKSLIAVLFLNGQSKLLFPLPTLKANSHISYYGLHSSSQFNHSPASQAHTSLLTGCLYPVHTPSLSHIRMSRGA